MIGDGREYVSFSIARGTWRLAFVLMIDVVFELEKDLVIDLEMLVIAGRRFFFVHCPSLHDHTRC